MAETEAPARPAPDGRVRAVVEAVTPSVDGGRFAAKRVVGDRVDVEADCFADGHDVLAARLLWRREAEREWREAPMAPIGNDRWRGSFTAGAPGRYRYTVTAWVDRFLSWRHDFARRVDPDDIRVAALVGAELIEATASRAAGADRAASPRGRARSCGAAAIPRRCSRVGLDEALAAVAERYPDRRFAFVYPVEFPLVVDRERARFSTWYELFPRSDFARAWTHGTFRDCEARLAYVAAMGFDVLYLPPIHPIGREQRKGREQRARRRARRRRQPVGDRRRRGRAQGDPSASSARSRTSGGSSPRRATAGSRSRSTSPSSARPTIRTSRSTRSGSAGVPTARSSTPRIRPRSTRTSTRSTSSPTTGARCGRS